VGILKRKVKIQATDEGQHLDSLTTQVISLNGQSEVRGNNYTTYEKQTNYIYQAYNAREKYGVSILGGLIDMRAAFIGGAGISISAKNKKTQGFIDKLFMDNQFYGSRFIDSVRTGEMEGKCLLLLLPDDKKQKLKIRSFSYHLNKYNIEVDPLDSDEITKISYKTKTSDQSEKRIDIDKSVYIKLGGTSDKVIETPTKIGKVLTQIENYERCLYDLRSNNHVFGKNILNIQVADKSEVKQVEKTLNESDLENGFVYIGTGKMFFVAPDLNACTSIEKEMLLNAKIIATETSIPIHWLSWLELINAKATAENMSEVISQGTWEDRTRWQEKITELIQKAMVIATERGYDWAVNDPEGFQVSLPLISLSTIQALVSVWLPLQQNDVISMSTLRNRVPEIDANVEKKLIETEKEENMQRFENNLELNQDENLEENKEDKDDIQSKK
jgi:hypothetical protein